MFLALLDALGAAPAHIVGFSDGGEYALLMTEMKPSNVRSIATWGPAGSVGTDVQLADMMSTVVNEVARFRAEVVRHDDTRTRLELTVRSKVKAFSWHRKTFLLQSTDTLGLRHSFRIRWPRFQNGFQDLFRLRPRASLFLTAFDWLVFGLLDNGANMQRSHGASSMRISRPALLEQGSHALARVDAVDGIAELGGRGEDRHVRQALMFAQGNRIREDDRARIQ